MSLWDTIGGTAALIFGRISGGDEKEITVDSDGHIQVDVLTTTGTVDVSDRAARDLGKVDVADIDGFASVAGQKTKATSFPVTRPIDDEMLALVGAVDETAPASDTASSGLNGRLQRVAQRITSLIGLLPASIGQKAKTGSLAVTLAIDEDLLVRTGEVQASPTSNTVLGRLKDLLTGISLAAGPNLIGKTQPFAAMLETGLTELIGINEQVDQNDFCASVDVALGSAMSGELLNVTLFTTEDGTGAIRTPDGTLYVFDANPSISNGDTAISAAAHVTEIGHIDVEAADWVSDANGASCHKQIAVAFHSLSTLYFSFKLTSADSFNDVAGDDEQLEFNAWYRRDS